MLNNFLVYTSLITLGFMIGCIYGDYFFAEYQKELKKIRDEVFGGTSIFGLNGKEEYLATKTIKENNESSTIL